MTTSTIYLQATQGVRVRSTTSMRSYYRKIRMTHKLSLLLLSGTYSALRTASHSMSRAAGISTSSRSNTCTSNMLHVRRSTMSTGLCAMQSSDSHAYNVRNHRNNHHMQQQNSLSTMRQHALEIVKAGIQAVDPYVAVTSNLEFDSNSKVLRVRSAQKEELLKYDMKDRYNRVVLISFGKASFPMALAVSDVLAQDTNKKNDDNNTTKDDKFDAAPSLLQGGYVIVKDDHATAEEISLLQDKYNLQVHEASHPVPDNRGVLASHEIMKYVKSLAGMEEKDAKRTLIVCCISGGGSALFCTPRSPLTLKDMSDTNQCLLESGMSIEKMNVIRKRLEDGKGGGLAAVAYPCSVLTLVLSDIIGDPLDLIASGPTVPDDKSCWEDAIGLVEEYGLQDKLPLKVMELMRSGSSNDPSSTIPQDTPKSWTHPEIFAPSSSGQQALSETVLVGNNQMAVSAAAVEAARLGYHTRTLGSRIVGEAADIAKVYTAIAHQLALQQSQQDETSFQIAPLPAAIVCGGETTVTLPNNHNNDIGKGGRNQEIGLVAGLELRNLGLHNVVIASVGTDGTDGPTDAAGAIVDVDTIDRIESATSLTRASGEDALRRHDAYHFLDDEALVKIGPTGTNVADIAVILVQNKST